MFKTCKQRQALPICLSLVPGNRNRVWIALFYFALSEPSKEMYIFLERNIPERMQKVLQAFLEEIAFMATGGIQDGGTRGSL
jgi:hypothetical protein